MITLLLFVLALLLCAWMVAFKQDQQTVILLAVAFLCIFGIAIAEYIFWVCL